MEGGSSISSVLAYIRVLRCTSGCLLSVRLWHYINPLKDFLALRILFKVNDNFVIMSNIANLNDFSANLSLEAIRGAPFAKQFNSIKQAMSALKLDSAPSKEISNSAGSTPQSLLEALGASDAVSDDGHIYGKKNHCKSKSSGLTQHRFYLLPRRPYRSNLDILRNAGDQRRCRRSG